jgi:osmotically-inducible protein OsmY
VLKYFYALFNIIMVISISLSIQSCSSILSATTADPIGEEDDERSAGSFIDDEIIETKALVNIDKADPQLAQSHVVVTSFNGVVLLAGQVSNETLRQLAAETVAKVGKVRRVHNELAIAGNSSMVARSNDAWITTKVKSKMLTASKLESGRIKVVTENGVVYLMGLVSKEEANRAADLVRKTAGVQKVVRIFEYI